MYMNDSQLNHVVGAAVIALFAGAVSFLIWFYFLVWVGLRTGLLPIVIFGPQPKQLAWEMLTIFSSGIFAGGIVAWVTFRVLNKNTMRELDLPPKDTSGNQLIESCDTAIRPPKNDPQKQIKSASFLSRWQPGQP